MAYLAYAPLCGVYEKGLPENLRFPEVFSSLRNIAHVLESLGCGKKGCTSICVHHKTPSAILFLARNVVDRFNTDYEQVGCFGR